MVKYFKLIISHKRLTDVIFQAYKDYKWSFSRKQKEKKYISLLNKHFHQHKYITIGEHFNIWDICHVLHWRFQMEFQTLKVKVLEQKDRDRLIFLSILTGSVNRQWDQDLLPLPVGQGHIKTAKDMEESLANKENGRECWVLL